MSVSCDTVESERERKGLGRYVLPCRGRVPEASWSGLNVCLCFGKRLRGARNVVGGIVYILILIVYLVLIVSYLCAL